MRTRPCLIALLAAVLGVAACKKDDPSGAATLDRPDKRTTFVKVAPVVGAKRKEASDLDMTVSMTVDGKKSESTVKESVRHTDEVLAVKGDAVTKLRATFDSVDRAQPSSIGGKTYVVEAKDGKLAVLDAHEQRAPDAEAKEVEAHFTGLGRPDPMLAALPSGGVLPGQKIDAMAAGLTKQLEDAGERPKDVVVTFKGPRDDHGVFDVAFKLSRDDGPVHMVIDMKGEAFVSTKTGATSKMILSGPIAVSGGNLAKADGSGKIAMKLETTEL